VVDFGFDAIAVLEHPVLMEKSIKVLRLKSELMQADQLYNGVGVVGTAKPISEIIGPPIDMAAQMEHHGVAMNGSVSRAVYELILGGIGAVKERGEITVP
jgi:hypothetical protein